MPGTDSTTPYYPGIIVELSGDDGNGMYVVGKVARALRRAAVAPEDVSRFVCEATSGDYDHLLQTCMRWVEVD